MFLLWGALLSLATAVAGDPEVIILDDAIDKRIWKIGDQIRQSGQNAVNMQDGNIQGKIWFSGGLALGFDSIKRTKTCILVKDNNKDTFDLHFGYGMLSLAFRNLTVHGDEMSAVFRIRDNSLQLSLTKIVQDSKCRVQLHIFGIEELRYVSFDSSRPEYDGMDPDRAFDTEVRPYINAIYDRWKPQIEASLEKMFCKIKDPVDSIHYLFTYLLKPHLGIKFPHQ